MKNYKTWGVLLVIFILMFSVTRFIPFFSDDYWYGSMGLDWAVHWHHYNNWSGRVGAVTYF